MKTMTLSPMLILVSILVLASLLLSSCGETGALTEKQVIQMTYDYLVTEAEQLQGVYAQAEKIIISWGFRNAVLAANEEVLEENNLGELVEMELDEPLAGQPEPLKTLIWTGALKKIAQYRGDGLWSVSIGDWEWHVYEATGEVIARNEEAAKLLEEITLKTYRNTRFGYYVDYPPSWIINDEDESEVWIFPSNPEGGEAFIFIHVIEEGELTIFEGLQGYIVAKLSLLQSQCWEFELIEKTTTRIDYTYKLEEDSPRHEAKRYFIQHESIVYEILSSAELTALTSRYGSLLYNPLDSFHFEP
jgi:hypothetical protein